MFGFRLDNVDGKAELLVNEDSWDFNAPPPFGLDIENDLDLPVYSSKDISALKIIPGEIGVTKVLVDGQEMYCKCPDPAAWSKIEREFECLQTIARSELASSIRLPKLVGLVERAETGKLVGILEAYVPHHPKNPSI
jgi:hypothetical protein